MDVNITQKVDKGEREANGKYDFYYEFEVFEFSESDLCYVARSYKDESSEAHFLRKKISGKVGQIKSNDLKAPLFLEATKYLRQKGKTTLKYLGDKGYEIL